jgi:D-3-phosphoglycerate dehydrogenase / 2-oxoglutarate reductase
MISQRLAVPGRVLVIEPYFDLARVEELLAPAGVSVEFADGPAPANDVVGILGGPDQPITRADLDGLPNLRVVATCSVGFDHVDVVAAEEHGVVVANVPDYCVDEMADSTLALVLSLLRGVVVLDRDVHAGGWDDHAAGPLPRIRGTRLGIVGFGRVGRAVAERALALGMEVWATDPIVGEASMRASGARPAALRELLGTCRAVTLHVPLTEATQGLVGADELALLPPGAVLVNTARAALVDWGALAVALESGRLAAAAFDVLPEEPPREPPRVRNLVVTPHAAWYSEEAEAAVYERPALAVLDVLQGRVPRDAVGVA